MYCLPLTQSEIRAQESQLRKIMIMLMLKAIIFSILEEQLTTKWFTGKCFDTASQVNGERGVGGVGGGVLVPPPRLLGV